MQYVIGEIWLSLVAAALLAGVVGWLLHNMSMRGSLRAAEARRNLEIEEVRSELESERIQHRGMTTSLDASKALVRELEFKLQTSSRDAAELSRRQGLEVSAFKVRLAEFESLERELEIREQRIEGWQQRFDGLVTQKDATIAELATEALKLQSTSAESSDYRNKLAAMGTSMAAAVAAKESLESQLTDHRQTLETLRNHLRSTVVEKRCRNPLSQSEGRGTGRPRRALGRRVGRVTNESDGSGGPGNNPRIASRNVTQNSPGRSCRGPGSSRPKG